MNRVEVLDRVGGLLLLPNTELATTKQVAEFYGISQEVIRDNIRRYKEELEANGLVFMPNREVIAVIGWNQQTWKQCILKKSNIEYRYVTSRFERRFQKGSI